MAVAAPAPHTTVQGEEDIVFLCGIVEADTSHGGGDELGQLVGNHKRQRAAKVQVRHAVQSKSSRGLFFQLDVDDARHPFRVVFGRGISDNLHTLYRAGGYLLQQRLQIVTHHLVGPAVDKHFYA